MPSLLNPKFLFSDQDFLILFFNLHIGPQKEQILYCYNITSNNISGKILHIICYHFMFFPEFHYFDGLLPDKLCF